jgi:acyl transferase domain-containing protein/NAD(P)-dependent dehydrogenase (short-subunit alcohol dehydrogenase family)
VNRHSAQAPLAIIGIGCRFPDAPHLTAFGELLYAGRSALRELPPDRFNQERYYDPEPGAYGKSYCRIGGVIEDSAFDFARFGLSEAFAQTLDPAHRWALDVAWDTFAHANIAPAALRGANVGVVLGHARGSMSTADHAFAAAMEELVAPLRELAVLAPGERNRVEADAVARVRARYACAHSDGSPGPVTSAIAGLIAAVFGLTGRHMVVDAACASSLAALNVASRALRQRSVDMALAGGVSFSQEASVILFAQSRALSADGSFPFDARANGFIPSDGVGMVLLERLEDALENGHTIYGLVRGIGASCDGKGKGLWAPRKEGQMLAIERALAAAGVDGGSIGYVEAHGTSTALGDATEVAALASVLGPSLEPGRTIPIGSVKGNVGHTREAAGMAGVVKVLLALAQDRIAPSIGYELPNPEIRWQEGPFRHATKAIAWPRGTTPRMAAVNSFGIGGLNYQVLVEEPPPRASSVSTARARPAEREISTEAVLDEPIAIVGMGSVLPSARGVAQLWERLSQGQTAFSEVPPARWPERHYLAPEGARPAYKTYGKTGGFLRDYQPDWRRYRMPPALVANNDPLQFMLLDSALDALEDAGIDLEAIDRRRVSVFIGSEFGSDFALALTIALRVPEVSEAVVESLTALGHDTESARRIAGELGAILRERLTRINEDSSGSSSASTLASRISKSLDLQGSALSLDAACASSLASLEIACEELREGTSDIVLYGGGDRSMRAQRFETYSGAGSLSKRGASVPYCEQGDGFVPAEGAGMCVLKRLSDAIAAGDRIYAVVRAVGSASDGIVKGVHEPSSRGLALAMRRAYDTARVDPRSLAFVEGDGAGTAAAEAAELVALQEVAALEGRSTPLLLGSVKSNIGHAQGAAGVAAVIKTALAIHHGAMPPTPALGGPPRALGARIELPRSERALPPAARAGINALGLGGISYHVLIEASPSISARATGELAQGRAPEAVAPRATDGLCFLFAGQGSQYPSMLREIAAAYPAARARLEEVDAACVRYGQPPVSQVMWGDGPRLGDVLWAQLSVLAADLMMAEVARAHDLVPDLVSAHSYGDYPAMVFTGVLSLEAVVQLTILRCRLIEEKTPPGAMISLFAGRDRVAPLIENFSGAAFVSNINSPGQVVVSCDEASAARVLERALAARVEGTRLAVPRAFHSPLMREAAVAFAGELARFSFAAPRMPYLASMACVPITDPKTIGPALAEQLVRPVEFVAQIEKAYAAGLRRFVEIGPKNVLSRLVGEILGQRTHVVVSLDDRKRPGVQSVERALSALRAPLAGAPAKSEAGDAAAGRLFPAEHWRSLSQRTGFGAFWAETRPQLQALTERWFEQPECRPALAHLLETARTARGRVQFFDATEKRRAARGKDPVQAPRKPASPTPADAPSRASESTPAEEVRSYLLAQVIEFTGYPADLIDFAADMEADLGIDTVKQAQIFGRLRERYDLATDDRLALSDFPTLTHVLNYVVGAIATDGSPSAGEAARARPVAELPSPDPRAASSLDSDARILHLAGDPFEMGLLHGRSERDAIVRLIHAYKAYIGEQGMRHQALQEALANPEGYCDQAAIEEIQGLAEGSQLPFRHLLAYNLDAALFPEYGAGCTQAGMCRAGTVASPGHGILHAANEDSPLSLLLGSALRRVVQIRRPARGQAHVLFSHVGQVGGVNGISAGGLVVTSAVLLDRTRKGRARGLIHTLLVRKLLEECATTEAAATLAERQQRTGAWSLLFSHRDEARLRCFEYDDDSFRHASDLERHLAANHALLLTDGHATAPPQHSVHRLERLREMVDADSSIDAAALERVLLDRFDRARGRVVSYRTMNTVHRVDNVMTLIAEPAAGRVRFASRVGQGEGDPHWRELRFDEIAPTVPIPDHASGASLTSAFELPGASRWPSPVMTRYVLRTRVEPLEANMPSSYRPERIVLVGDGAVADALLPSLRARGSEVILLPLEDDPDVLTQKGRAIFERGSLPDIVLLSGLDRESVSDAGLAGLPALAHDWPRLQARTIEGPYLLLQEWAKRLADGEVRTLCAMTALGGTLGHGHRGECLLQGGAVVGHLKALRQEFPRLRVKLLDTELREAPDTLARALLAELDAPGDGPLEVGFLRGERQVLRMFAAEARVDARRLGDLQSLSSVLVTGGARGITAEAALRLARSGVRRLHLIGRTPLDPRVTEWRALDAAGIERLRRSVLDELRAERDHVAPLEWQKAVEGIDKSLEIDKTLRRLGQLGASATYHAVDVADRAALAEVLERIRRDTGPIEAVVHGAGVEHSRAFLTKTRAELLATLAPKVEGAIHLLTLLRPDELRWFVAFSSVSGRFGGHGQADYSLASELLAQLVARFGDRTRARVLTIDWPAWDEVGMAARPAIRSLLASAGQDFMSPAEGGDHFMAELASPVPESEVVYAGRLDAIDRDHLLAKADRIAELAGRWRLARTLPLIDVILTASDDELSCECHVDAADDAFLREHCVGGKPTLPAVVSLELLAEAAAVAQPGAKIVLEDVTIASPLKLRPDARLPLSCRAERESGGFKMSVAADVLSPDGRVIVRARSLVVGHARSDEGTRTEQVRSLAPRVIGGTPWLAKYGPTSMNEAAEWGVFHGPVFRGLEEVIVAAEGEMHTATLVALPEADLRTNGGRRWIVPAATLDCCLQACGALARARFGAPALPARFGRLSLGRALREKERCRLMISVIGHDDRAIHFDFHLVGDDGATVVLVERYSANFVKAASVGALRGDVQETRSSD